MHKNSVNPKNSVEFFAFWKTNCKILESIYLMINYISGWILNNTQIWVKIILQLSWLTLT